MKKRLLLLIMIVASVTLNAQVFVENFETAATGSNVEGYNSWYVCPKASDALGVSPKVDEGPLFFTGYKGSDIGKVAKLDSLVGKDASTQRISTKLITFGTDTLKPVVGKKMYAAFLVQVQPKSITTYRDFFTWEGSTTSSFTRGRVFAKVIAGTQDLQFAVSKNSSSAGQYAESTVMAGGVGVNHLLVLCYETIDGDANDVIKLYINPDPSKTEAQQTVVLTSSDVQTDYTPNSTKMKINLRQRGVGALVGGIRVGTNWNEVLKGTTTGIQNMNVNKSSIHSFGNTIVTSGSGKVQVYDLTGRQVMSKTTDGNIQTSLRNGIYLVRFEDNNGKIATGKVVLNEY